MGNQMFQYAFAKAGAKRLHTFFLPFQSDPWYPFKLSFFQLDCFTRFVYSHPKLTKQYHRVCRKLVKNVFKKHISDQDGLVKLSAFENGAYYHGFFQSDGYFSQYESIIRKSFTIKKTYKRAFEEKYGELLEHNKLIVIHVRRRDYNDVEFPEIGVKGVALPESYYKKALESITDIDNYKILVISDDIESVKNEFAQFNNVSFEENEAIVDFQLIQHADMAIISNSTFAWWAAYLSVNEKSVIIGPKYWLGFKVNKEFPLGIETDKFKWIEV